MEPWFKKSLVVVGVLVAIVPLGILITWNYGDAWGEWGEVDDGQIQWTPQSFFGGLLPDYNVEGWESKTAASVGYWISAVLGIGLTMVVILGFAKLAEKRKGGGPETPENGGVPKGGVPVEEAGAPETK
ncbi:MAG: hypothetical protein ACTSU5_01910 [Promethearchaeota archaeon]